ncbi:uncharacterized protein LOC125238733 [Leguminivora glycinivorella]|uniref:uncharacterized protein LOC125238733 n=1 Tax=Leguminivora glycinivorella TaxID=1035111 RepID=UPI0020106D9D|nr:uncharacterized protein LOC125238733 [Leguminivora glycinivorella]
MWWQTAVLAVAVVVVAQQFNPNDQNDFIDNEEEEEISTSPIWVSTEGRKKDFQGKIEKLLGQPIIQYEEPNDEPAVESTRRPTKPASISTESEPWDQKVIGLSSVKKSKSKTRHGRHRTTEVIYSVRVHQWDDNYPQVGQKIKPGVIESLVKGHEIVRYEPRRAPGLHTPSRTEYVSPTGVVPIRTDVLPVRNDGAVRTDVLPVRKDGRAIRTDVLPVRKGVGAVRPGNRTATAYNEGGFRYKTTEYGENLRVLPLTTVNDSRRYYLLTVPGALLSPPTRRPRPTPVTHPIRFKYEYTRRTKRHPNCTDSYYECLFLCFDRKGYRVNCPWDTRPPTEEPARLNFTGLFWAIHREKRLTSYDMSLLFMSYSAKLIEKKYRECRTWTTTTTTLPPLLPLYYDEAALLSPKTGRIIAKCWVCGLQEFGIPQNSHCADNFGSAQTAAALTEKNSYRRYCRYMDDVPLWFNRSDPLSVFGEWTGGCAKRWIDLSGLYTQRTCRSVTVPAQGHHFLSKRMARLELALREVREGCVESPMATLVPFSRAVSLYARFHVCVCKGLFCNAGSRKEVSWGLIFCLLIILLRF